MDLLQLWQTQEIVCFVCCLCQYQHFYVQKNLDVNSKLGITVLQRIQSLTYSSSFLKFLDSLITHMEMVTEIVLPTVFTLCILISIVLLIFYLRNHS